MGVKLSHAFGAHTVLFTTSPGKTDDAKRLGADESVVSKDTDAMLKHAGSFDLILNTVAASHNGFSKPDTKDITRATVAS